MASDLSPVAIFLDNIPLQNENIFKEHRFSVDISKQNKFQIVSQKKWSFQLSLNELQLILKILDKTFKWEISIPS